MTEFEFYAQNERVTALPPLPYLGARRIPGTVTLIQAARTNYGYCPRNTTARTRREAPDDSVSSVPLW